MGNSIGGLIMFNHRKKKTSISMIGDRKNKEDHRITCIKYSTNGKYLCYGRSDGLFQFVDPYTLTPIDNISFKWNKSPVQHITFSDSSKKDKEPPKIVKSMKTESFNEPQCMTKSTINTQEFNFMISGNDLRLSLWDNNRCICTTHGVNLGSPIRVMKESPKFNNDIFFCNDTDIGIIRQPIDGNPYKNAAVLGSGTKIIDIGVSMDSLYIFSISENSPSMIIWSVNTNYLDKLEKYGGVGLKAYSYLLEGGRNGPEISELKEYFSCVQLANSQNPETTVIRDYVDVYNVSFLVRAMGYFPSETELSNMLYEMFSRAGHPTTMTFEEFVILYLNHKPQLRIKCNEIRLSFNKLMQNDQYVNAYGENKILTRESFVHMMTNIGEKISPRELEIILNTLLKTTKDISSSSNENANLVHLSLPFVRTFI
ncbi:unnamed protein product [Macrosiphum euphorbiae]|uniref:Uncharacterized protein n=1 Tax=Macrosiphum euphorbiae TaxID=13131 RepID=A0AAV0WM53_9HEMI|nr:unnamed protein product [Macrosiphum euphorbiae]